MVRCRPPISSSDGRSARARAPVAGHFGEKAGCPTKTGPSEWTCRHCRRRNETALVAGETLTCVFCHETSDVPWLQDLAREIDDPASFPGAAGSDRAAGSMAGVRLAAADGLRAATRDFAEEFLRIDREPVPAS